MGTPFRVVYDAFLARIEQDEWSLITDIGQLERDWFELLKMAINRFMFPRVSLEYIEIDECFVEELSYQDIQLLATFMRNEWLKRTLSSWELLKQQYSTKDFQMLSQANHMDRLREVVKQSNDECKHMTNQYSRVIEHKPYDWVNNFAGGRYGK